MKDYVEAYPIWGISYRFLGEISKLHFFNCILVWFSGLGGLCSSLPSQGQLQRGAAKADLDLTRGNWAEVAWGAHPLTLLKSPNESKSNSTEAIAKLDLDLDLDQVYIPRQDLGIFEVDLSQVQV